jgi:hypothetical protein
MAWLLSTGSILPLPLMLKGAADKRKLSKIHKKKEKMKT